MSIDRQPNRNGDMREFIKQQVTIFVERRRARREKLCAMIHEAQEKMEHCQERLAQLENGVQVLGTDAVSYTHLTLPTKA